MCAPYAGRSRVSIAAIALVLLASLSIVPTNASSEGTTSIDLVIGAGTYQQTPVAFQAGETVKIDADVQSGPDVGFYFVDQTGYDAFVTTWPAGIATFTAYIAELSEAKANSIHKSASAPADGLFYLIIANDDPSAASVVAGTVRTSSSFPAALLTVVLIAIAITAVVVVLVAVVITRSVRAKAQQYAPPGQPTPQGQTHQYMTSTLRPVVQQSIGGTCPKCGATVARDAAACAKCGTRL